MPEELVVIRTFSDEQTALLARAILEANGISSVLSADSAGHMEPQLEYGRGVRLIVQPADAPGALELLGPE
jgi:hypothetical protein